MILNTEKSYGLVSIVFHWIMAVLFLIQFWIGLTMESEPDLGAKQALLSRHISIGILILGLWVSRIIWSLLNRRPTLPQRMERGERRLARASHLSLLTLLGIIPLTGWLVVSTMGGLLPFRVFDLFALPPGAWRLAPRGRSLDGFPRLPRLFHANPVGGSRARGAAPSVHAEGRIDGSDAGAGAEIVRRIGGLECRLTHRFMGGKHGRRTQTGAANAALWPDAERLPPR